MTMEPKQVTTITRFSLAPEEPLPTEANINSPAIADQWLPHLKKLLTAKGHVATWISRIEEVPEEVLITTDWYPDSNLIRYQLSPAGLAFTDFLTSKSGAALETETIAFTHGEFTHPDPDGFCELVKVFFDPKDIYPQGSQEQLLSTRGLAHWHAVRHPHLEPRLTTAAYTSTPNKGFPVETEKWHDCDVNAMVWVNYWRNAEMEAAFKRDGREVYQTRNHGKVVTEVKKVYDIWADKMVACGALGWRSEHFTPRRVHAHWLGIAKD